MQCFGANLSDCQNRFFWSLPYCNLISINMITQSNALDNIGYEGCDETHRKLLTHWGLINIVDILQTTFPNALSWIKFNIFPFNVTEFCSQDQQVSISAGNGLVLYIRAGYLNHWWRTHNIQFILIISSNYITLLVSNLSVYIFTEYILLFFSVLLRYTRGSFEDLCVRRYQGHGHVITSHGICGV